MIAIETPCSDRALLTLAEIKAAVGETGTENDGALEALALRVSDMISDLCGVARDGINPPTLLAEEITETIRFAVGQPALLLSRRFVSDIDSVTIAGSEISAGGYELEPASGVIRRIDTSDNLIAWPAGKTVIVYTAGFDAPPEPLKAAAKDLARIAWNAEGSNPLIRSETHDGLGTFQYSTTSAVGASGVSSAVMDLLAPYRSLSL